MIRAVKPWGRLLATGVLSFIVAAVSGVRDPSLLPASQAAPVAALTACPAAKPEHGLLCGRLSVPEDRSRPDGRRIDLFEPVRTSVPAFIVTGALDPVTPTRWGQRLLANMPNARLIDVPGMSHELIEMDNFIPCIVGLTFSFWNLGTSLGLDTSCVATMKPPGFFVPPR